MRVGFSSQQNTSQIRSLSNSKDKNVKDDGERRNVSKSMKNGVQSGKTKKKSPLEILMEQKSQLEDNKNTIVAEGLKNGEDAVSIKQKTADIDKQIQELDNQISKLQLEDKRKALGEDKSKNKKSKGEVSNNNSESNSKKTASLDGLLNVSVGFNNFKNLSHIRNNIKGNIRELKADIEFDVKFRHIDPVTSKKNLAKMEESINNVDEKISESLKDINNETKRNIKAKNSDTIIDINGEPNHKTSNSSSEDKSKLSIEQQKIEENIKRYVDNVKDKSISNGEKINNIA
ncbi:hypothetical protein HBE96_05465 [Clostridium sp. P21]|uniref:Uncharacterized protein n=1 Tax=Clostridium muellerianum TaxID=2716538 RepID=A0A7Y0HLP2_9CLOT|nr:hypothetical protein [Clostridium muellerianum]NMM62144.1 hypothetical protein [Clostridium muellerianum]